jgi:predicted CXXCH cytochrome family protein
MNARTIVLGILLLASTAGAQTLQNLAESQRDCAVCHLEWTTDFDRPGAVLLMDKPAISMASRETTCLGCHDGSVRDSRRKVWQEQSHKTGVTPPPTMQIPTALPLEDGKIACRTCHTAHNVPGAPNLSNTFFLRVQNDQSQLCRTCHTDKTATAMRSSHPLGRENFTPPAALTAAGSKVGPKGNELICQSCHEAHGSKADKLLVLPAGDNTLCVSCHDAQHPGRWTSQAVLTHPVNAPLSSEAQRQAIRDMGTHVGPNDTLACLSCHRLHNGPLNAKLLADTDAGSKLCLRCHPDRITVAGTVHDLRKNFPTTRNVLGQTAVEAGPCGGCHVPHQFARDPIPAAGDPSGQCTSCHSAGRLAAKAPAHFNHPDAVDRSKLPNGLTLAVFTSAATPDRASLECITCHDPHVATRQHFLRKTPDELCASCHEQSRTLAGAHDFTTHAADRNGLGLTASQSGKCGFCHDVHKGNGSILWVATSGTPANAAELCTKCHSDSGLASQHPVPGFSHPTDVAAGNVTVPLPLFDARGQRVELNGTVQCASCHNPHSDTTQSHRMLRVAGNTSDLCLRCHSDKSSLAGSKHDAHTNPAWAGKLTGAENAASANDLCMACHLAHTKDAARREKLWAGPIDDTAVTDSEQRCLGCHNNQIAPRPEIPVHPQVVLGLINSAMAASGATPPGGYLPTQQSFACGICHQPHGSSSPELKVPASLLAGQPAAMALEMRGAARTMVRPDVARDICATCHGSDAQRVFLYYHRARQRQDVQMLQQPVGLPYGY